MSSIAKTCHDSYSFFSRTDDRSTAITPSERQRAAEATSTRTGPAKPRQQHDERRSVKQKDRAQYGRQHQLCDTDTCLRNNTQVQHRMVPLCRLSSQANFAMSSDTALSSRFFYTSFHSTREFRIEQFLVGLTSDGLE